MCLGGGTRQIYSRAYIILMRILTGMKGGNGSSILVGLPFACDTEGSLHFLIVDEIPGGDRNF